MKRLVLTVTATIAGLAALLSFKTQSHPLSDAAALPSAGLATGSTRSAASAAPPTPGTSSTATSRSAARSSTAPASATRSPTVRSYLGAAVTTRYGTVQVKITTSGKKITEVAFAQLTAFDPHSQQINSYAGPQLLKETLSAQSAQVDTISGASYTSDGYRQSLQSALDRAGL